MFKTQMRDSRCPPYHLHWRRPWAKTLLLVDRLSLANRDLLPQFKTQWFPLALANLRHPRSLSSNLFGGGAGHLSWLKNLNWSVLRPERPPCDSLGWSESASGGPGICANESGARKRGGP